MTGARGSHCAGHSGSTPNSSGSTAASTSSTAAPFIVSSPLATSLPVDILGHVSLASPPPAASLVVAPTTALTPAHVAETLVALSSHSTVGLSMSESQHIIELDGDGSIFCRKANISHIISMIFKKCFHKEGHVWKEVPSETEGLYWDEFVKTFQWDPTIDALVKREWAQKVAKRYINNIRKWHANGKPTFVPNDVWDRWTQKWEQDETFKKRPVQASLNCLNEMSGLGVGPSRHTGGSIFSAEHKRRMTEEFGRKPMLIELFEQTHFKKIEEGERTYVDRRSASVTATQPNEGFEKFHQPDCDQIFLQAVGGKNKKKKIYGTGSLSQSNFSVGNSSTVSYGLNENPVIQEMTENLDENLAIQEMAENIKSQAQELNDLKRQMSEMRALIEQFTASTHGIFPSSQPQSTHQPDLPNVSDNPDD